MQVQAISKNVRISPRKVRLVAEAIRALSLQEALVSLRMINKRAAHAIAKTLESAVANATNNAKLDKNNLRIADIEIAEGQALKRFHPSTRGRIHPYKKRSSHIRVVLEEKKVEVKKAAEEKKGEKKL
jgi:large subunit ribosomal protein L22